MVRWLAVGSLLLGCPEPLPTPAPFTPFTPPAPDIVTQWDGGIIEIGTQTASGFRANPGTFELERGAQGGGGRHAWVSYRVTNSVIGQLVMNTRLVRASDGVLLSNSRQETTFVATDGGYETGARQRVIVCPPPSGVQIPGTPLRLEVWAELVQGSLPLGATSIVFDPVCSGCEAECGG